jgi:hypothetical protein
MRSTLLRRERSARAAERFLGHLASDSFGRQVLDDAKREAKRAAFV